MKAFALAVLDGVLALTCLVCLVPALPFLASRHYLRRVGEWRNAKPGG